MRNEDKLLLLAEIMGVNTSKYIEKYIDELRSSDIFIELCRNVAKARGSNSFKAQTLIDEFEFIDFNKVKTLKDVMILKAQINYLYNVSEQNDKINPLLYDSNIDSVKKLDDVVIEFDGRDITLNDMILDERYTIIYKLDYFREQYLAWRKEVVDMTITPLKMLTVKSKNYENLTLFSNGFLTISWISIIANICFIFLPLFPSQYIRNFYLNSSDNIFAQVIFYVVFLLLVLLDMAIAIYAYTNIKENSIYISSLKVLNNAGKVIDKINNRCVKLHTYIIRHIVDERPLEKDIVSFTLDKKDVDAIACLVKLDDKKMQELNDIHTPWYIRLAFFLLCITLLILMIVIIVYIGGF